MTFSEKQKLKLVSIFHRRGSPGQFTRKFEESAQDDQNDLLNQAQLSPDELPVIASRRSSSQWVLITTNRTIAADSGSQYVIRHVEIEEVSPPKLSDARDKQQWSELTIHLNNGARRVIHLEPGPPFMGVWNVLLNLARFNHRSTEHSNMKDSFLEVLRGVLETRGEAGRVLLSKAIANDLSRTERTMICEFLAIELIASGIEANEEPNARGLLIESVIDFINHPNLR